MSFIAYLIVLIFAAGSALFGLDLLTSPLPQHNGTRVAATAPAPAPDKLARRMADSRAMEHEGRAGTLTPIYADHPGEKEVHPVTPTNPATRAETQDVAAAKPAETTGAAPGENATPAPSHSDVANVSPPPKAASQPLAQPAVQPQAPAAAQPAAGHCDIAACSAAYHSFRASDCTYQPYAGPRRACVAPPSAQRSAQRAKEPVSASVRAQDSNPAPVDVRAVARQQALPQQDDYDDDADDADNAADADDIDMPDAPSTSVVIIQRPRW